MNANREPSPIVRDSLVLIDRPYLFRTRLYLIHRSFSYGNVEDRDCQPRAEPLTVQSAETTPESSALYLRSINHLHEFNDRCRDLLVAYISTNLFSGLTGYHQVPFLSGTHTELQEQPDFQRSCGVVKDQRFFLSLHRDCEPSPCQLPTSSSHQQLLTILYYCRNHPRNYYSFGRAGYTSLF